MSEKKKKFILLSVSSFLSIAVAALLWDTWWHVAVGRDSFWIPPHIFLYLSVILSILAALYGWLRSKDRFWRKLTLPLLLIPFSAPFDEMWHRIFGVENLNSPLVIWSPPHILLLLGILGGLIICLSKIRQDREAYERQFFELLSFASILSILFIFVVPFLPRGPYEVIGFWGAGVIAFVVILVFLMAQKVIPGIAEVTMVTFFFIAITAIGPAFSEQVGKGVLIPRHGHQPSWLIAFAYLVPAIFMDLAKKLSLWAKAIISGLLWSTILFGFSSLFLDVQFRYSIEEGGIAIIASAFGACIAVLVFRYLSKAKFLFLSV